MNGVVNDGILGERRSGDNPGRDSEERCMCIVTLVFYFNFVSNFLFQKFWISYEIWTTKWEGDKKMPTEQIFRTRNRIQIIVVNFPTKNLQHKSFPEKPIQCFNISFQNIACQINEYINPQH